MPRARHEERAGSGAESSTGPRAREMNTQAQELSSTRPRARHEERAGSGAEGSTGPRAREMSAQARELRLNQATSAT